MLLNLIFLALLFIFSVICSCFYIPTKTLYAWFSSSFHKTSLTEAIPSIREKGSEIKRVFATFDKNGDGVITSSELGELMRSIGEVTSEKDVEEMIEKLDVNGDGLIQLDEFAELFESTLSRESVGEEEEEEEVLKDAFGVFDGNKDGMITEEELGLVLSSLGLKEGKKIEVCKEMINKVDTDGDGMVNFEEFKRMMRGGGRLN